VVVPLRVGDTVPRGALMRVWLGIKATGVLAVACGGNGSGQGGIYGGGDLPTSRGPSGALG